MPSNEKQLNETMSGQELKNELAQEVEKFKQSGDSLGFACSAHKHIVYPGGTDLTGYIKWAFKPKCDCGAVNTPILVQRISRQWIGNALHVKTWTKNKEGEWINEEGNEWPEYSKKLYFKLAT
ncbi:hypothetical protein FOPG_17510 [Fusarium oxysporum f. sp. conglutinans race 2 54008]|uniref:Uncharacterized protein n=1 Tax=Fusarium oxysporum f. sp. conglutinans race 2 54008 TaxID=1089457 RepID=X0HZ13_FUSOX|nr:hypothetical protein FOPG_17510 [Fusarium oxysporum f. sp. conglutinans race 2 54008]KAI8404364.1 hypothetical protein FOFC_15859 [Fusarium oxysporum]